MKKREMIITIGKGGQVGIEVQGVPGSECLDFSEFLEEELGVVVSRQRTAEFFQETEKEDVRLKVGGGD